MNGPGGSLIAIDVGNTRAKAARFASPHAPHAAGAALPEPIETLELPSPAADPHAIERLAQWLAGMEEPPATAWVAAVHRDAGAAVRQALAEHARTADGRMSVTEVVGVRLPITTRVDLPEGVGVDRLLAAVAANRMRHAGRAAIVVDVGTAITVDLVAGDGAFEGGAILPGIRMAARALHEQTDTLPASAMDALDASPPAVGKSTDAAIRAGLYWGAVGAIREIIARQRDGLTDPPQVFLTGGAAPSIARLLGGPDLAVRAVPHLVLSGIALAAASAEPSPP